MSLENFYVRICRGLSEIIPHRKKETIIFPELKFAGIKEGFDFWIGKRMFATILACLTGFLLPWTAGKYFNLIDFQTISFALPLIFSVILGATFLSFFLAIFYLHLYYQIYERASMVEYILPDFLMLVASNINAGLTPISSFRSAARKEFGPLSEEIKAATTKSLGADSFTNSLREVSKKIKSKTLSETVSFFSQSLRSGGHLSMLLETSAKDLRQTQEMKRELVSNTRMYLIFIGFIVVIITPVLLSVSVQFLKMVTFIQAENQTSGELISTVAFLSTNLAITPEFMQLIGILLLFINSLLSSLFIGMLSTGKAKMGVKNFPIILVSSIIVFFASTALLEQVLSF